MGREIRRVPPHWDHPIIKDDHGRERKQPMYDKSFSDAVAEWKDGFAKWEAGERPDYCSDESRSLEFWEYEMLPPTRDLYRPWSDEDATWWQLWETVTEGTPVSPPFETQQELADYLAVNGDEWDQKRCLDPNTCQLFGMTLGKPGWGKDRAERFVFGPGWSPSLVVSDGLVTSGVEAVTKTPN